VFDEELVVVVAAFQTPSLVEELAMRSTRELAMKTGDVGALMSALAADVTQLRHQSVAVPHRHLELRVRHRTRCSAEL